MSGFTELSIEDEPRPENEAMAWPESYAPTAYASG
jgi:hypothetical protein